MDEIDKLDKEHTYACRAFLDASDTLDDAREARHAANKAMLIAAKALNKAVKEKFLSE